MGKVGVGEVVVLCQMRGHGLGFIRGGEGGAELGRGSVS